jgi:hypothetical protein
VSKIFYFTPYHPEGLGKAYNEHCSIVPHEDDWICIQDSDVMFFSSQVMGHQIQEAIDKFPEYDVFTCVTNRICWGCEQQIRSRQLREEKNIVSLKQEADRRMRQFRGKVQPLRGFFAGYFMVFRKKLWDKIPFPEVGSQGGKILGVDSAWASRVQNEGYKVGLMLGLMAAHFYRLDKGEGDLSHLDDPGHDPAMRHAWSSTVVNEAALARRPLRLTLNENLMPPSGYWMRDSDGVRHEGPSASIVVKNLMAYRKRLGRPEGNPLKELTEAIYARHPQCCILG